MARGVQITVKDNDLDYRQYQTPLPFPSQSPLEIAQAGFALFRQHYFWDKPVRALTIRGINLVSARQPVQLDMFCNAEARERRRALDDCVDEIRRRFGNRAICAASLMGDLKMAQDKCETVMITMITQATPEVKREVWKVRTTARGSCSAPAPHKVQDHRQIPQWHRSRAAGKDHFLVVQD